jgi:Zinc finger, C2H2 type
VLSKHRPAAQAPAATLDVCNKVCPFCYKIFSRLASHIKRSHPDQERSVIQIKVEPEEENEPLFQVPMQFALKKQKAFKCHFCDHVLLSFIGRHSHERKKHQDLLVKCPKADCNFKFVSVKWMESHLRSHHAKVTCDFCDKSFIRRSVLMEHIRASHPCGHDNCTTFYRHRTTLVRHIQRAHNVLQDQNQNVQTQPPPSTSKACPSCGQPDDVWFDGVACFSCQKNFHCQALLDEHFLNTGGCITLYHYCSLCSEAFTSSPELMRHMTMAHFPETVWSGLWRGLQYQPLGIKCNACRIFFRQQQDLSEHLALVHSAAGRQ